MKTISMSTTSTMHTGIIPGASGFHHKRISWASIFAGILVALGIQLLLTLLGIGIGMGAINPLRDQNPVAGMGTPALMWWGLTLIISLFIGGWISGRFSRSGNRFESMMHGILTWVVFVILNVYLLTNAAGSILSSAGSVASSAVQLTGQTAVAASPTMSNQLEQRGVTGDSASIQAQINKLKAQGPEAEAKARQIGDQVASTLSKAGIYAFLGLLIGAIIAAIAASMGRGQSYSNYDDYDSQRDVYNAVPPRPGKPVMG